MYKSYDDVDKGEKVAAYTGNKTITINDEKTPGADKPGVDSGSTKVTYGNSVASFKPSQTYLNAMQQTQNLLNALQNGRTSVSDQLTNVMNQISNREKFSYDSSSDVMFQNNLESYKQSGQMAMQDTMGQAAALTGGYGSTYATSAANQAYNAYLQDAYNNIGDYYNMALQAYQAESDRLNRQYDMYANADNIEYSRMENQYQRELANANQIYDQEYNNYWQTQQFNEAVRQNNNSLAQSQANLAYQKERDKVSDAKWEKEYQLSLNSANAKAEENAKKSSALTEPTQTQMEKAMKAWYSGGDSAIEEYLATLPDNIDVDKIATYINQFALNKQSWENTKDTWNFGGGIDYNDQVTAGDKTMTLKELYNSLVQNGMPEDQAEEYVKMYNKKTSNSRAR